jgi:hypothetical protein
MSIRPQLVGAVGKVTDTYTAENLGIGSVDITKKKYSIAPGAIREENGRAYKLCLAAAAIGANAAVAYSGTTGYTVAEAAATGSTLAGVAETAIDSGAYGWITIEGLAECEVADNTAALATIGASASAGVAATPANTVVAVLRAIAIDANSSGDVAVGTVLLFPGI